MARNDTPNTEVKQTEANSIINAFVNKVGRVLQTENANQIENIIDVLKNDTDKIMLLLTPEEQSNSSDLYKLIQSKKVAIKNQLKWNGVKINQHSPYMTLVLFAVMYISSRNSRNINDYEDYVKTFNLDEAHKLSDLIETVIDMFNNSNFSTGAAALKKPTKEEIQAAKLQYNDQSKFARWYIASFGAAFDCPDLRHYMELWNKALKEHIIVLEKQKKAPVISKSQQSNDLLKVFDSWVNFQDTKPSKENRSFGLARTFISKTSGSQEFATNSLNFLVEKYGRCKTKPREIVIQFWNDCVGEYDAKNDKFSIDTEKFEKSKRDIIQLENNKQNTTEITAKKHTKKTSKKAKLNAGIEIINKEKNRIGNLHKVITNLKNKEKQLLDFVYSIPDDNTTERTQIFTRLTRLSVLRANLESKEKPLQQKIKTIGEVLKQIDMAEKEIQEAKNRLQKNKKLLKEFLDNQK